jgi:hypothetical protein
MPDEPLVHHAGGADHENRPLPQQVGANAAGSCRAAAIDREKRCQMGSSGFAAR